MGTSMEKFLDKTKDDNKIVDMYIDIRKWLQSEGHTTITSQSISKAPMDIWKLMEDLRGEVETLRTTLKRYGILEDDKTYNKWLQTKLLRIDKEFPLIDEKND
jgi:hypothetical protein|tara:strand:+ start:1509 stop:1817 length:309 start_codon:yes stop_codon:yes gene_type:complete